MAGRASRGPRRSRSTVVCDHGQVLPRPVIGLSTYRETARWGVWTEVADLLGATYTRSVEAAGGTVVLLPPQAQGAEAWPLASIA